MSEPLPAAEAFADFLMAHGGHTLDLEGEYIPKRDVTEIALLCETCDEYLLDFET